MTREEPPRHVPVICADGEATFRLDLDVDLATQIIEHPERFAHRAR
ncbi:MAG: hypothetical protein AB1505_09000 [Candidatus Latescibacterota bacterium]